MAKKKEEVVVTQEDLDAVKAKRDELFGQEEQPCSRKLSRPKRDRQWRAYSKNRASIEYVKPQT